MAMSVPDALKLVEDFAVTERKRLGVDNDGSIVSQRLVQMLRDAGYPASEGFERACPTIAHVRSQLKQILYVEELRKRKKL